MNQVKVCCCGFAKVQKKYFEQLNSGEAYVLFNNITMCDDALRVKQLT
jgi:uncharacterized protein YecE (DUF72 family)